MGETTDSNATLDIEQNAPRAIIHKQILDHAEANPDESMEAIADAVSGATTSTVERVLEEYGDPAAGSASEPAPTADAEPNGVEKAMTDAESVDTEPLGDDTATLTNETEVDERPSDPDVTVTDGGAASETATAAVTADSTTEEPAPTDRNAARDGEPELPIDRSTLTEKQRETLRAIYDHPDATQAELADRLGVSSPTISQRVNSIDGFDWADRNALVAPLFESDGEEDKRMPHADDSDDGPDSSERDGDDGSAGDATDESRDESSDRTRRRTDSSASRSERTPANAIDRADADARLAELTDCVDELADQLAAVERELEDRERGTTSREGGAESSVLADPELAHKIVHACVHSDRISEEEELRLLRDVTAAGAATRRDGNSTNSV
ncbi:winged helix-turn-helix domain-containing protein [Haloterrigena salifodinae]|uniref:winged helix-turn-helix domain-containing protein n=1 Tax=Haloterrigena salifodinae TaxID=2675099 RepID=UPI001B86EE0F|nr:winged helix-turn-helix domain-containing protein [Haloterrigena salifodinae]